MHPQIILQRHRNNLKEDFCGLAWAQIDQKRSVYFLLNNQFYNIHKTKNYLKKLGFELRTSEFGIKIIFHMSNKTLIYFKLYLAREVKSPLPTQLGLVTVP